MIKVKQNGQLINKQIVEGSCYVAVHKNQHYNEDDGIMLTYNGCDNFASINDPNELININDYDYLIEL